MGKAEGKYFIRSSLQRYVRLTMLTAMIHPTILHPISNNPPHLNLASFILFSPSSFSKHSSLTLCTLSSSVLIPSFQTESVLPHFSRAPFRNDLHFIHEKTWKFLSSKRVFHYPEESSSDKATNRPSRAARRDSHNLCTLLLSKRPLHLIIPSNLVPTTQYPT